VIDLHSHTNDSDGSLTPQELIQLAVQIGLEALAITDHDTFAGYQTALPLAQAAGLDLLRGIELNSIVTVNGQPTSRYAHILAYFPKNAPAEDFIEWLDEIRRMRRERNEKLIAALRLNGIEISLAEVETKGRSLTGRPHFARVLVDKGYAISLEDAFHRYLGEEAPSYIHRESLTTVETVAKVRKGGGIPVVAHPIRLGMDRTSERRFLEEAKSAGLLGLEVYHSEHSPDLQKYYLQLASELELLPTGGSDFHGPTVKPDIELGTGRNHNVNVPLAFLIGLRRQTVSPRTIG
jgi:predicted metal-dependent phosphoesterase TrpH